MFLNNQEEKIIEKFYTNIDVYAREEMILLWEDGNQVTAEFDTCFEDDNNYELDDENYEEYTTFVFKVIKVTGKPPIHITEDNYFCIDYRNFPDEIIANGVKIN